MISAILIFIVSVLFLYLAARIVSTAYFKAKEDYRKRLMGGKEK